jgi:H+-transporting ATPase
LTLNRIQPFRVQPQISLEPTPTELSQAGFSQKEAQRRLAQYGTNELPEKKTNPLLKFMSYFWGPIPWMIEAAVVLSALVWS